MDNNLIKINIVLWSSLFVLLAVFLPLNNLNKTVETFPEKIDKSLDNFNSQIKDEFLTTRMETSTCIFVEHKNKMDAYCMSPEEVSKDTKPKAKLVNKSVNIKAYSKNKKKADFLVNIIEHKDTLKKSNEEKINQLDLYLEEFISEQNKNSDVDESDSRAIVTLHEIMNYYKKLDGINQEVLTYQETQQKRIFWILLETAFKEKSKDITAEIDQKLIKISSNPIYSSDNQLSLSYGN